MLTIPTQIDKTVSWLQEKVHEANAEGLILGVSGGIDSAVCAFLIKRAFSDASLGLILPCKSGAGDVVDALAVIESCQLNHELIDLTEEHDRLFGSLLSSLDAKDTILSAERRKMADANLRARLRMCTLYAFANALNYLVVGTDNAAELYTGYFTKYGDGAVDILPIANLPKREVREWAKHLGVPEQVITKAPSAGLWEGQTDEEELGVSYDIIDDYMMGKDIPEKYRAKLERLHSITQHKRETPPKPPPFNQ